MENEFDRHRDRISFLLDVCCCRLCNIRHFVFLFCFLRFMLAILLELLGHGTL